MWKQIDAEIELLSDCGFNKPHANLICLCHNGVLYQAINVGICRLCTENKQSIFFLKGIMS